MSDMNNNNSFFNNIRDDEFETSKIQNNIDDGEFDRSYVKGYIILFVIIAFGISLIFVFLNYRKNNNRNSAEIPTIESQNDNTRIDHEMPKMNEVYENASIYDSASRGRGKLQSRDMALKPEHQNIPSVPSIPEGEPKVIDMENMVPSMGNNMQRRPIDLYNNKDLGKTTPVKQIKTVTTKRPMTLGVKDVKKPVVNTKKPAAITTKKQDKTASVNDVKVITPAKRKFIEKKTDVDGEVEITYAGPAPKMQMTASKPMAKITTGNWSVQLSSATTEHAANSSWISIKSKHSDIIGHLTHKVIKTTLKGKVFYRLRVVNLSVASAKEICDQLKSRGVSCFATK